MCELIGPEKVKESFFGNNIDMVLEELSSICGTKKDAQKFISLLDDEARCDTTLMTSNDRQEKIDALETKRRVSPVIDTYIRIYYESKFNRKIDEDKLMLAYMDSLRLTNNLQSEFYHENNIEKKDNPIPVITNEIKKDENINVSRETLIPESDKKFILKKYDASIGNEDKKEISTKYRNEYERMEKREQKWKII